MSPAEFAAEIRQHLIRELRALLTMAAPQPLRNVRTEILPGQPVAVTTAFRPAPMFRKDADARRVLRIEVDRDREYDIVTYLHESGRLFDHSHADRIGPRQFDGVDLYVVDQLPEPGWRIINPFKEKR